MSSPPLKKRIIFDRDISPSALVPTIAGDVMTMNRSKSTTNVNVVSIAKTIRDAVDSLETHFQCNICFDVICKSQRIPECGHRFCRDCIKDCINKCKRECPVCRCPVISTRNLREEKSFDELILSFREAQKIIKEQIDQLQGLQEMVQVPSEINVNHDLLSPKKKPKVAREPDLFDDESNYSTEILPLCLRNQPNQKPNVQKVQSDASQSEEDDDEDESDEEILPVSKRQQAKQNSSSKASPRTRKDDSRKKKSEDEESEFSDFSSNSSSEDEEEDLRPISSLARRLSSQSSSSRNLQDNNSTSSKESHYSETKAMVKKFEQGNLASKNQGQGSVKKIGMRRKQLVIELLDSSDGDSIDSSKETKDKAEKDQAVKQQASSSRSTTHVQRTKDTKNLKSDSTHNSDVIFDSSSDEDSDVDPSDFNSLDESDNRDLAPLKAKSSYNTYRPIRRRSKQPELYGSPVSADDDVIENILNSPGNVLSWTNDGSSSENENRYPKRRRRTRKGIQNGRERQHRKPERFGEIADSKEVDKFISSPENILQWKNVAKDSDNELSNGSSDEESNESKGLSTTPRRKRRIGVEVRPESYQQRWSDRKSNPTDKFTYNF